jgi:hypothetical protein
MPLLLVIIGLLARFTLFARRVLRFNVTQPNHEGMPGNENPAPDPPIRYLFAPERGVPRSS